MNKVKKIIALITVIFVVIRVYVFSVSASFAAPFIAEETLKTALIEGMLAGGSDYSKEDLEAWDLDDLENEFEIQMTTNPNFEPKKAAPKIFPFIPFSDTVLGEFLSDFVSDYEKLSDSVEFTPTVDLDGSGCLAVLKGENNTYNYERYVYGDYGIVNSIPNGKNVWERLNVTSNDNPSCYFIDYIYNKDGSLFRVDKYFVDNHLDSVNSSQFAFTVDTITSVNYYGDWRYADDTPAETDDLSIPVIGDADGTQVTPDMLNPDGTVTIGDTTYYPKDFIDWDKFKDPAIIDLLNDILTALENIPVVSEQDKPIVDVDDIELSVPEELSDYAAPIGISNVFPFCIPWDIVRGFQILNRPSVTPKFEIPFNIPEFGLFDGVEKSITIDFTEYDKYIQIFRWFQILGFSFLLCKLSLTRVKGAGA